ncbi:hypothetical protein GCM10027456_24710 [Kineosporia babensis]
MKQWVSDSGRSSVDEGGFAGQDGAVYGESAYGQVAYGAEPMPPATVDWSVTRDR